MGHSTVFFCHGRTVLRWNFNITWRDNITHTFQLCLFILHQSMYIFHEKFEKNNWPYKYHIQFCGRHGRTPWGQGFWHTRTYMKISALFIEATVFKYLHSIANYMHYTPWKEIWKKKKELTQKVQKSTVTDGHFQPSRTDTFVPCFHGVNKVFFFLLLQSAIHPKLVFSWYNCIFHLFLSHLLTILQKVQNKWPFKYHIQFCDRHGQSPWGKGFDILGHFCSIYWDNCVQIPSWHS